MALSGKRQIHVICTVLDRICQICLMMTQADHKQEFLQTALWATASWVPPISRHSDALCLARHLLENSFAPKVSLQSLIKPLKLLISFFFHACPTYNHNSASCLQLELTFFVRFQILTRLKHCKIASP